MALWSTQPLTDMSTREFPGGKCGRCVRLTNVPPPCAVVMKSGNLNFLEPSGPLRPHNGTAVPKLNGAHVYHTSQVQTTVTLQAIATFIGLICRVVQGLL